MFIASNIMYQIYLIFDLHINSVECSRGGYKMLRDASRAVTFSAGPRRCRGSRCVDMIGRCYVHVVMIAFRGEYGLV